MPILIVIKNGFVLQDYFLINIAYKATIAKIGQATYSKPLKKAKQINKGNKTILTIILAMPQVALNAKMASLEKTIAVINKNTKSNILIYLP